MRSVNRQPPNRKTEQSDATRAALIAAARLLFAERGYASVSTEEIVRAAGVTRGALYHQFRDKTALFRAVVEQVEQEIVGGIAQGAMATEAADPWDALRAGAAAFLDVCLDPAIQRIALIDAPSVLGWDTWREIGATYGLGLVEGAVRAAIEAGIIEPQPSRPLAHILIGALDEGAMVVARADDVVAARAEVGATIDRVLQALRR